VHARSEITISDYDQLIANSTASAFATATPHQEPATMTRQEKAASRRKKTTTPPLDDAATTPRQGAATMQHDRAAATTLASSTEERELDALLDDLGIGSDQQLPAHTSKANSGRSIASRAPAPAPAPSATSAAGGPRTLLCL